MWGERYKASWAALAKLADFLPICTPTREPDPAALDVHWAHSISLINPVYTGQEGKDPSETPRGDLSLVPLSKAPGVGRVKALIGDPKANTVPQRPLAAN